MDSNSTLFDTKHFKTPQEKKRLSYKNDRRNTYGENSKSSRKSIRMRKAWVNQTFRRTVKQTLKHSVTESDNIYDNVAQDVKKVKRKFWKKLPDEPLGLMLKRKGKLK